MSLKINFAAAEEVNKGFEVETENTNTNEEMVEMTNVKTVEVAVSLVEMVREAGLVDAGAIRLFAMETRAVTKQVIADGIEELGYELPSDKKAKKIVFADVFARAYEMELMEEEEDEEELLSEIHLMRAPVVDELPEADGALGVVDSATDETSVAEDKPKEEFEVNKVLQEVINKGNMKALENSNLLRNRKDEIHVSDHKYVNPGIGAMKSYLMTKASEYNNAIGTYDIMVEEIEFFERGDSRLRYGRIGAITIAVPRGYMTISEWDPQAPNKKGELGAFVSRDMADHDYNQTVYNDRFAPLHVGSGRLTLAIKDRNDKMEQGLFVGFPKSPSKEVDEKGNPLNFYDILKTCDVRWGKPHSDNNRNLEAALSAFLRVWAGEFIKANVENFHALKPSCLTCRFAQLLGTKDGVSDDLEDAKSNKVLQQNDIPTLVAFGSRTPIVHCQVKRKIMDFDMVLAANQSEALELEQVYDSELGDMRYLRKGELYVEGRIIKGSELRYEATREAAEDCSNYHGNVYKGEARAAADRIAKGNPYESSYWTDRAEVGRMAVQSLTNGVWENVFPADVEDFTEFRVIGLGGIVLYGTEEIMADTTIKTVPVEEFDTELASIMNKINQIYFAAFNFNKLSAEQANIVFEMAANKPELEDNYLSMKWDNACTHLANTVVRITEGEKIKARPKFTTFFFEGKKPANKEGVEVNATSVIDTTLYREEHNQLMTTFSGQSLGYKDLAVNPKEFISYLDEVTAEDIVWDVLLNGSEYYVKGKSPKDKKLVAGALQELLQRRVDNFLYDIRREANPGEALANFDINPVVKDYIIAALGLKK